MTNHICHIHSKSKFLRGQEKKHTFGRTFIHNVPFVLITVKPHFPFMFSERQFLFLHFIFCFKRLRPLDGLGGDPLPFSKWVLGMSRP